MRDLDCGHEDIAALAHARHGDPFRVLGPHAIGGGGVIVSAYYPGAIRVDLIHAGGTESRVPMAEVESGFFQCDFQCDLDRKADYRLRVHWPAGAVELADPYAFPLLLTDYELHLMAQGRYFDLPLRLGANERDFGGHTGILFCVWAPNARSISVVGDFNSWDARRHPMRLRREAGVWELFIPQLKPGEIYKYAIRAGDGTALALKADPMARRTELPPKTGSIVAPAHDFTWTDSAWMMQRDRHQNSAAPITIYEVHVESWLRTPDKHFSTWDEAGDRLLPYVQNLGFTHIELMPIAEHPFGGSWGYQPLSLFAPTARLGDPSDFARFVDRCHAAGIGVLLDWVPAHFPSDQHGLARFDGTALYEHEDPREGFHQDWNTLIYNFGRLEVRGFLISSALWWLETFHLDGLRVDAVASMLYRDYSRKPGAWIPNTFGGRENLEAVAFLQELNTTVKARCKGAIVIAEESTAWPGVTAPDGLGFTYKWNMGWMHDTLRFFARDPVHRRYHLDDITFGLQYCFSESFMLPLSHDEVVHGKGSLISRMPGDDLQRFANLRLLLALMWTHPGKKLLFMGGEFAAEAEWNADAPFPWPHPYDERRQGLSRMVAALNSLYRSRPQLHVLDTKPEGFAWVIAGDAQTSVFAFRRSAGDPDRDLLVVFNPTPVARADYAVGVPTGGHWTETFNSDSHYYGGSNVGNSGAVMAYARPLHSQPHCVPLTLPPLGLLILEPRPDGGVQ